MPTTLSAERIVEDLRVEIFRRRISQGQLALATGMSQSAISRRLNREVEPTLAELMSIAAAANLELGVEIREAAA